MLAGKVKAIIFFQITELYLQLLVVERKGKKRETSASVPFSFSLLKETEVHGRDSRFDFPSLAYKKKAKETIRKFDLYVSSLSLKQFSPLEDG